MEYIKPENITTAQYADRIKAKRAQEIERKIGCQCNFREAWRNVPTSMDALSRLVKRSCLNVRNITGMRRRHITR